MGYIVDDATGAVADAETFYNGDDDAEIWWYQSPDEGFTDYDYDYHKFTFTTFDTGVYISLTGLDDLGYLGTSGNGKLILTDDEEL